MSSHIRSEVKRRGISRLCHFSPSKNFVHIATGAAILSTSKLKEADSGPFSKTDASRLDRHETHICCSIEYPNVWYLERAKTRDDLFRDWVVLLIDPKSIWKSGTKFSPRNAASDGGNLIKAGDGAFDALFAKTISGAQGRVFSRSGTHLPACPTDLQAEVLVEDSIPTEDILGVAVATEGQAKNEMARLELLGMPKIRLKHFKIIISPEIFDKNAVREAVHGGVRPTEQLWTSS